MGRVVILAAIFIIVYLICYMVVQYLGFWGELLSVEVWHRG